MSDRRVQDAYDFGFVRGYQRAVMDCEDELREHDRRQGLLPEAEKPQRFRRLRR